MRFSTRDSSEAKLAPAPSIDPNRNAAADQPAPVRAPSVHPREGNDFGNSRSQRLCEVPGVCALGFHAGGISTHVVSEDRGQAAAGAARPAPTNKEIQNLRARVGAGEAI